MNRTRTALLALLATITVPGLAACSGSAGGSGGTVHTGSAAVVGGQRISIATVEDQTSAFREAAPAQGGGTGPNATLGQDAAGEPSRVLAFLIQDQVIQTAVDRKGLHVSATDVAAVEAQDLANARGLPQLTAEFVSQLGLPPQDLQPFFRQKAEEQALLKSAGVSLNDPNARVTALATMLRPVAASLGISVNPRYGTWDPTNLGLGNAAQPWIKQVSQAGAS